MLRPNLSKLYPETPPSRIFLFFSCYSPVSADAPALSFIPELFILAPAFAEYSVYSVTVISLESKISDK
jgi:hypothetical protein